MCLSSLDIQLSQEAFSGSLCVFSECVSTVWNKQIGEVKDEGRIDEHTEDKRDDWALCCNTKNEQVTAAKATSLLS